MKILLKKKYKISKKDKEIQMIKNAIERYEKELKWYNENWIKMSKEDQDMYCCIHCWSNYRIFYLIDKIKRTNGWLRAFNI